MGLSKLTEKCQTCKRKDTCDDKRMEACAYIVPKFDGTFPIDNKGIFVEREGQSELIGRISNKSRIIDNEPILESLAEAVQKSFEKALKENPNIKIDWFCHPRELR